MFSSFYIVDKRDGYNVHPMPDVFRCNLNDFTTRFGKKTTKKCELHYKISTIHYTKILNVEGKYEPYQYSQQPNISALNNPNIIPILKSNLQKCIRRKKTTEAIITADELIRLDFNTFIRRLIIIMIEDVFMIPNVFSVIVWLTIASSKDFIPDLRTVSWLLGVVKLLSEEDIYDSIYKIHDKYIKDYNSHDICPKLTKQQKTILYPILIRKGYGGLPGDMKLLDKLFYVTSQRLEKIGDRFFKYNRIVKYIMPMSEFHELSTYIIKPSIDFHCTNLDQKIAELYDLDVVDVKDTIWFFRSCVNIREKYINKKLYKLHKLHVLENKLRLKTTYDKIKDVFDMLYYVSIFN